MNIGAAARAMANFGCDDLVVVDPYEPVWRETLSAVGAEAVVLKARSVRTPEEAVGDCQVVLGTTANRTRRPDRPVVRLPDLGAFLDEHGVKGSRRIALLFGSEKTGLSAKVLDLCSACLTIPTSAGTPSMNLSHAVAVCCYELAEKHTGGPVREASMATADSREQLVRHVLELFDAAGYLSHESPARKTQMIRRGAWSRAWSCGTPVVAGVLTCRVRPLGLLCVVRLFVSRQAHGRAGTRASNFVPARWDTILFGWPAFCGRVEELNFTLLRFPFAACQAPTGWGKVELQ